MLDAEDDYILNRQKAKLQTSIGCFFGIIFLGLLVILVPIWLLLGYSEEAQLKMSHSPNNINTIEVIKKDDFPDPTLIIKYDNESIMKNTIPDTISVNWNNDFEAKVILTKLGQDPSVIEVKFK